jgi:GTPase SAR1 family protein
VHVGAEGSGKTSLIKRFLTGVFSDEKVEPPATGGMCCIGSNAKYDWLTQWHCQIYSQLLGKVGDSQ